MKNPWSDKLNNYKEQPWIDRPSIFSEQAIEYFPHHGDVLELGAGLGQDSRFFAEAGYTVVATDISGPVLEIDKRKVSADIQERLQFQELDISKPFPIEDKSFDVVYAHLSLHYFNTPTTRQVFSEIKRVLKPGGTLAFLVNSVDDPEYGEGTFISEDYYLIDHMAKRYFSEDSVRDFVEDFDIELLDNHGETYKDRAKGVHNLIRFVGKKKNQLY